MWRMEAHECGTGIKRVSEKDGSNEPDASMEMFVLLTHALTRTEGGNATERNRNTFEKFPILMLANTVPGASMIDVLHPPSHHAALL